MLFGWILTLVLAGGGAVLFGQGTDNSFSIPGTEAQEGIQQLDRTFPQAAGTAAQFIVVAADGDRVDEEPYASAMEDESPRPRTWTTCSPSLTRSTRRSPV